MCSRLQSIFRRKGFRIGSLDEAKRKLQNVIELLQLSEEQAEQLGLSML